MTSRSREHARSGRPHTAHASRPKQTRSSSAQQRRTESPSKTKDKHPDIFQLDDADENFVREYFSRLSERHQGPKLGLQHQRISEPASSLLRQSGIYRHPALTPGQKLCLLQKCHVYDSEETKRHRTNSCLQMLDKRFSDDLLHKSEYRLNDPRDFYTYNKFLSTPRPTPRPLNTGYNTPRNPHSARSRDHYDEQYRHTRVPTYLDRRGFAALSNSPFN